MDENCAWYQILLLEDNFWVRFFIIHYHSLFLPGHQLIQVFRVAATFSASSNVSGKSKLLVSGHSHKLRCDYIRNELQVNVRISRFYKLPGNARQQDNDAIRDQGQGWAVRVQHGNKWGRE